MIERGCRLAIERTRARSSEVWLGVIGTPDQDVNWRFDDPRFAAWVARDGECVPAMIEIEAERTFSWQRAQ